MKLHSKMVWAFAVVAMLSAAVSGLWGLNAAQNRVQHYLHMQGGGMQGNASNRQKLMQSLKEAQQQASLAALLLGGLAGLLAASALSRPILQLVADMQQYQKSKNYTLKNLDSTAEIRSLQQAFYSLTTALTKEEERQKQLIADLTHDLRTPLTIVRGDLESIQDEILTVSPEQIQKTLSEVLRLSTLVEDMRLLTLAQSTQLPLKPETVNIAEYVSYALSRFSTRVHSKNIAVQNDLQEAWANMDVVQLERILDNIFENAVQYTPEKGVWQIRTFENQGQAVLEVHNSGAVLSVQDTEKLFDRAYRADAHRNKNFGGSGLGLAIVKALVELHGGTVRVQNPSMGGLKLMVHLPCLPEEGLTEQG